MTIIQTTPEQLAELLDNRLEKRFEALRRDLSSQHANDELLSREQACDFLQITSSTLWDWTNKNKVQAYGIGNRRYYKRSELMEALTLKK